MQSSRCKLGAALLAVLLAQVGCPGGGGDYVPPELSQSDLEQADPSDVPDADLNQLVAGNTEFSFDLLRQLTGQYDDVFYSPHSISQALAMTAAGARGDTADQMADTLHFALPDERLHPAFNRLNHELKPDPGNEDEPFTLHLANAIWAQTGFALESSFLDTLALYYGSGVYRMDFDAEPEVARLAINNWVSHQTEDRINDLLPAGAINAEVLLVLTNAIYFKAAWKKQFKESQTTYEDFYLEGGATVQVPMMRQQSYFRYFMGDGLQAAELEYDGGQASMIVVLPDPNMFDEVATTLDGSALNGIIAGLSSQYLHLELPRFSYDASFELTTTLAQMGMADAVDQGAADFSGMSSFPGLHIMAVIHKAFVDVNEKGTEAAASTAVIMGADASVAPTPVEFIVDRPFIFMIRDRSTGTILFLGTVENPSGT